MNSTPLWKHQEEMLDIANKTNVLWWVTMGAGKTRTAIETSKGKKTLVICPNPIVPVWKSQFEVWDGNRSYRTIKDYNGANLSVKAIQIKKDETFDVFITNYETLLNKDLFKYLSQTVWDMIILDESHRLGVGTSTTAKRVFKLQAKRKIAMSGTPAPSPLYWFSQMQFLTDCKMFRNVTHFRNEFVHYENRPNIPVPIVAGFRNQEKLRTMIRPYVYTFTQDDLKNNVTIPREQRHIIEFTPNKRLRTHIEQMRTDFITELENGVITASNALVKTLRMRQLSGGIYDNVIIDSQKLDYIKDLQKEYPNLIVFSAFTVEVEALCNLLDAYRMDGKIKQLEQWRTDGTRPLVVQVDTGSEGIDLTDSCVAVYFSYPAKYSSFEQGVARIVRPSSNHSVAKIFLLKYQASYDTVSLRSFTDKSITIEDTIQHIRKGFS